MNGLVLFLIVESDRRATNPPPTPIISSNTYNQNFYIAILLSVVERSGNYVFEDDNPFAVLRERVVSCVLGFYKVDIEGVIV